MIVPSPSMLGGRRVRVRRGTRALAGPIRGSVLADKQAVVDAYLRQLAADPDRVRQLCGWTWLTAALDALPAA